MTTEEEQQRSMNRLEQKRHCELCAAIILAGIYANNNVDDIPEDAEISQTVTGLAKAMDSLVDQRGLPSSYWESGL